MTAPALSMVLALLTAGSSPTFAATGWGEDYEKAVAQAKAEKKMVLLDFTGSDWCQWCVKLDKDAFSKPEFKSYAKDHLTLVNVDFPLHQPQPKNFEGPEREA